MALSRVPISPCSSPSESVSHLTSSTMAEAPVTVVSLMKEHDFLSLNEFNKIHCDVTGHDMPAKVEAIQAHLASPKFKKAKEWYKADFSKYEPHITAHKKDPKLLFCHRTQRSLNRIPSEVEAHVNGRRFKFHVKEWEERKQSGVAEEEAVDSEEEQEETSFWMPSDEGSDIEGEEGDLDKSGADVDEMEHDSDTEELAESLTAVKMSEKKSKAKGTKPNAKPKAPRPQKKSKKPADVKEDASKKQPVNTKEKKRSGKGSSQVDNRVNTPATSNSGSADSVNGGSGAGKGKKRALGGEESSEKKQRTNKQGGAVVVSVSAPVSAGDGSTQNGSNGKQSKKKHKNVQVASGDMIVESQPVPAKAGKSKGKKGK